MRHPLLLEERIIAALRQALAEQQTEAAEHLLRAIEALCQDATPGTALAEAYAAAFDVSPQRSMARIFRQ
ncbi:hypothetical protein QWZ14_12110 [Paeniroseomonas aquatica]|uniref:Uncharacterized protein n=1 Tax=Paeniroseomonas aquatica TaxID=373043 RepID=A0ABT8A653_9PROT|nr:hypothetical protein [Paeniroseomonas aquatica]MDN3565106.1 hypothetical protein [Paeniroseomonas aquatica]